jgi:hypothetical protein
MHKGFLFIITKTWMMYRSHPFFLVMCCMDFPPHHQLLLVMFPHSFFIWRISLIYGRGVPGTSIVTTLERLFLILVMA